MGKDADLYPTHGNGNGNLGSLLPTARTEIVHGLWHARLLEE